MQIFKGEWVVGKNAGGSGNEENFWTNPQHTFSIKDADKSILVSISQEGIVKKRFQTKGQFVGTHDPLGFYIYSIEQNAKPNSDGRYEKNDLKLFNYTRVFKYQKELSLRLNIPIGEYVIFPCLFKKDQPGSYVLRVYTQSGQNSDLNSNNNKNFPQDNKTELDDRDLYDRLYYRGMTKEQIDEINIQAQENVSKACTLM